MQRPICNTVRQSATLGQCVLVRRPHTHAHALSAETELLRSAGNMADRARFPSSGAGAGGVGECRPSASCTTDPLGPVLDDAGLHQLHQELLLFRNVVSPRLPRGQTHTGWEVCCSQHGTHFFHINLLHSLKNYQYLYFHQTESTWCSITDIIFPWNKRRYRRWCCLVSLSPLEQRF